MLAYTVNTSEGGDDALANLRRSLEDKIVPELKAITGVNSVTVAGGGTKEVRITFSEKKLSDNNLTSSGIINTLQANNISFPTGDVTNAGQSIPVRVTNQFTTVDDLKNVVVRAATKGGTTGAQPQGQGQPPAQSTGLPCPAVKLGDVADVALVNAGGESR